MIKRLVRVMKVVRVMRVAEVLGVSVIDSDNNSALSHQSFCPKDVLNMKLTKHQWTLVNI